MTDIPMNEDIFPQEDSQLTGDSRTEARLCAIQGLYQLILMDDLGVSDVKDELLLTMKKRKADKKLFKIIFENVTQNQPRYVELVSENMADTWSFDRLDRVMQAILLCGVAELSAMPDTPTAIIVKEYLTLADAFSEDEKTGSFVHAVLDTIAKKLL